VPVPLWVRAYACARVRTGERKKLQFVCLYCVRESVRQIVLDWLLIVALAWLLLVCLADYWPDWKN
jgi:hypothetical protein